MLEIGFGGGRTNPRLPDRPVHLTRMAARKGWSVSPQTRSISGHHLKPASMRRVAFSRHVAGHHRIYAEGRYDRTRNMPTDISTLRAENAPTSAIRKSRFSEVHVARADTTSGSVVAVAITQYPSIQSGVLLRPGVSATWVLCPGPHKINRSPPNAARRGQACWSVPMRSREGGRNYFSELLIEVNFASDQRVSGATADLIGSTAYRRSVANP
jgi:hypothetical protein